MNELIWLVGIPIVLVGLAAWHRSLLSAIPAAVGVYIVFLAGLFAATIATVGIVWAAFAAITVPLLLYKFPGQYTAARTLTVLPLWPVLAVIAFVAERDLPVEILPDEIPGRFDATVSFIESAGTAGEYLIVFFEEFGDTAFFCDAQLESADGLRENARLTLHVEHRNVDELGDDVLWISAADSLGNES